MSAISKTQLTDDGAAPVAMDADGDAAIDVDADVALDIAMAARLRLVVARLMRRLRRSYVSGLTPTQLSALSSIEKLQPVRLGDLAGYEGISPSTLSPIVGSLVGAGYVERRTDPDDARSALVAATRLGHELLAQLRAEAGRVLQQRLEGLSAEERAALDAAIGVLERLAEE